MRSTSDSEQSGLGCRVGRDRGRLGWTGLGQGKMGGERGTISCVSLNEAGVMAGLGRKGLRSRGVKDNERESRWLYKAARWRAKPVLLWFDQAYGPAGRKSAGRNSESLDVGEWARCVEGMLNACSASEGECADRCRCGDRLDPGPAPRCRW